MVGGLAQLFAYGFSRYDEQQSRSPADPAVVAVRLDDVQGLANALGWARRRLGSRQMMMMHDKVQTLAEEAARHASLGALAFLHERYGVLLHPKLYVLVVSVVGDRRLRTRAPELLRFLVERRVPLPASADLQHLLRLAAAKGDLACLEYLISPEGGAATWEPRPDDTTLILRHYRKYGTMSYLRRALRTVRSLGSTWCPDGCGEYVVASQRAEPRLIRLLDEEGAPWSVWTCYKSLYAALIAPDTAERDAGAEVIRMLLERLPPQTDAQRSQGLRYLVDHVNSVHGRGVGYDLGTYVVGMSGWSAATTLTALRAFRERLGLELTAAAFTRAVRRCNRCNDSGTEDLLAYMLDHGGAAVCDEETCLYMCDGRLFVPLRLAAQRECPAIASPRVVDKVFSLAMAEAVVWKKTDDEHDDRSDHDDVIDREARGNYDAAIDVLRTAYLIAPDDETLDPAGGPLLGKALEVRDFDAALAVAQGTVARESVRDALRMNECRPAAEATSSSSPVMTRLLRENARRVLLCEELRGDTGMMDDIIVNGKEKQETAEMFLNEMRRRTMPVAARLLQPVLRGVSAIEDAWLEYAYAPFPGRPGYARTLTSIDLSSIINDA